MILRVLGLVFLGALCSVQASAADYCNSQDVPSSQVVIRVTSVLSTTCASGYRYTAEAPSNGRRVCAVTIPLRLPSGWVATEGWSDANTCGGDASVITTNQFTISTPRDGLWICNQSAPAGFSVVETRQNNVCAGRKTDSVFQYRLAGSGTASSSSSANPSAPISGKLQHIGGLCAYIIGGSPTHAGQAIGLASCTEYFVHASPVTLTLRSDGNLEVQHLVGWCLHPEGGGSNPGNWTRLVAWPSCGESRLKFELTAAGSLRHVSSGQCIHPSGGSPTPANGTELVFWNSCNEERLKFKFL